MVHFIRRLGHLSDNTFLAVILAAKSMAEAADDLDVARHTVEAELLHRGYPSFFEYRKLHGVLPPPPPGAWSDEMVDQLRQLLAEGKSASLIGETMGLTKMRLSASAAAWTS